MEVSNTRPRLVRFAEAGVVMFILAVPVSTAADYLTWPGPGPRLAATVATVAYLPLLLWLTWPAVRGRRAAGAGWVFAALAGTMVVSTAWVGDLWITNYGSLGLAALLVLPGRWAWPAFAAIMAAVLPASWATGTPLAPSQVSFVLQASLALAPFILIRLVTTIRELEGARAGLAADAVVRERQRFESDLWHQVGARLTDIVALGERAAAPGAGEHRVARHLRSVVDTSRTSLAGARRLVAEYRRGSLDGELDAAASLLRAVGIQATILAPSSVRSRTDDEHLRAALRRAVAELLRTPEARPRVAVLTERDGGVGFEVSAGGAAPAGTGSMP
ncbi:MAG: hypothetical protein ACRDT2_05470 [Natronosporangium sp.]